MKRKFLGLALGGMMLATVSAANAQYNGPWRDRRGDYDGRYGYERGPRNAARLVDRVLNDLGRVESRGYGHDRGHFDHARGDLLRVQEKLARGQFDRGKLDNAIGHMDHITRSRDIYGGDRDRLYRDLQDLRDLRSSGGYGYNGYGGNGGYGDPRPPRW